MHKITRQNEIDLLRVIAALSVFILHYTDAFNYFSHIVPGNLSIGRIFRYGYFGVPLFFVISGYVVTMSAMDKTFREFVISRISRLYPAFWLSCIIALLLPRIFPHIPTYIPYPDIRTFLYNLTMVPSVFSKEMLSPVYWSLLEEIHFYVIISIIIIFKLWNRIIPILIGWLIIYILVNLLGYSRPDKAVGVIVPKHSLYFIAGILFCLLRTGYCIRWKLISFLSVIFILFIGISFFYAEGMNKYCYKQPNAVNVYVIILINIAIFSVFLLIANHKLSITSNKVLRKLGDITYPFYLIHVFGLGLYWYLRNTIQPQVLLLLILFIVAVLSFLINSYLEKPAMKTLKKLLR